MSAKIAFIGAGNMASSLAGGLVSHGFRKRDIAMSDINDDQLKQIRSKTGVTISQDNNEVCASADVIVLSVKPQVMETVCTDIKSTVNAKRPLVISIAAGITLANLGQWLGEDLPLVRAMPNTPALVQTGATGLYANAEVSEEQKQLAKEILSAIGIALWVDEERHIDAVTALSGSGPAYYFLVMETMINIGQELGLSETVSKQLTLQTALGAAQMAIASDVGVDELRQRVTSPGGTTEQAIKHFEENGLRDLFSDALTAAYQRSIELAN